jgi:amidase
MRRTGKYPRVAFLGLALLMLANCRREETPAGPYQVEEVSLAQLAEDLADGKTTAVEVTRAYIDRINRYDAPLRSVMAIVPDALEQAAASDLRRKEGKARGPLDGIPILFKDNIDIAGLPTTAGSFVLERNVAAHDAETVKRMRDAGAIILGKNNLSQFSGLRAVAVLNGSTVGHAPHNPYNLARSPAGSSSGSAIAVATSFAAASVATDTDGTGVEAASVNGVAALRPTQGLVSRRGLVPLSSTLDTAGPIARNVGDLAFVLTAVVGSDPGDAVTKDADTHKVNYSKSLNPAALKGQRLGVVRGTRGYDAETEKLLDEAVKVIRAQGADVVELSLDLIEDVSPEIITIKLAEFKEDIGKYLAAAPASQDARTLADIILINRFDPRENMHDQEALEVSQGRDGRKDPDYLRMLPYAQRRAGAEGFGRAFTNMGLTAVIGVTGGPGEFLAADRTLLDRSPNVAMQKGAAPPSIGENAALAGFPHLTVPMGQLEGMPVGLSFVGPAWSEATLIAYAHAYERASQRRIPPVAYKNGFPPR